MATPGHGEEMLRLTILFDAPYWVGLVEKCRDDRLYVARHVFGAEPSDTEIEAFVLRDLSALMRTMTVGLPSDGAASTRHTNPKRMQREIQRALLRADLPTRAQEAMRLQSEANSEERRKTGRAEREALQQHKRDVASAKAKARHRGH